jgi:hypothetical protein
LLAAVGVAIANVATKTVKGIGKVVSKIAEWKGAEHHDEDELEFEPQEEKEEEEEEYHENVDIPRQVMSLSWYRIVCFDE